jgi:hypothetical protein
VAAVLAAHAFVGSGAFAPVPATAQQASAKGIYMSEASGGVKFNVLLERDGKEQPVSSGHQFRSGDRMRFQMEINQPAYFYVVHTEFPGNPASAAVSPYAGTKGIQLVHRRAQAQTEQTPASRPAETAVEPTGPTAYTLLFPSDAAGLANKLAAGKIYTVPWTESSRFSMDENPGIEKLYLVSSPTRLQDLEALFRGGNGEVAGNDAGKVTATLAQYSDNANVSIGKGIVVESYGVGVDAGKPFMTEVDLAHYPRD